MHDRGNGRGRWPTPRQKVSTATFSGRLSGRRAMLSGRGGWEALTHSRREYEIGPG